MKSLPTLFLSLMTLVLNAQSFTAFFTGSSLDVASQADGGICMMGGSTEQDEAMRWFLNRANGGDVLVLRASGSDGYNDYFYSELGVGVNSVETIVFNNSAAAEQSYIHERIKKAEAIWFAGGDQWDYVSYWRNSPIDSLINVAIIERNIVIGGTSAGMAILGKFYFSAQNGTVTSSTALNAPYDSKVRVDSAGFLNINYLQDVITDTHYDDPNRKGRHVVFLARVLTDYGIAAKGIACNEKTAVCIDENGLAHVFGNDANPSETAFFLQPNCELADFNPENCTLSAPLEWNLNGTAIRVYKVKGTENGSNTFSLADWKTGEGGSWENWSVDNGVLTETDGLPVNCIISSATSEPDAPSTTVFPNPFTAIFNVAADAAIKSIALRAINGKLLFTQEIFQQSSIAIDNSSLSAGVYFLRVETSSGFFYHKLIKQ